MIPGTEHWDSRSSILALAGAVLGVVIWMAPGAACAEEEEQLGQQGAIWNLGTRQSGRRYPTTVSAHNKSCSGKRDFRVTVEGEATRFLEITGPTDVQRR